MNLRGLQTLCQRQGRQDGGQALGEHRLAAARRTYHDEVMTTGSRYLQRPLDAFLTFHIGEVVLIMALLGEEFLTCVDIFRLVASVAIHKPNDIHQRLHAVDFQLVDDSGLPDVLPWDDKSLELLLAGADGDGQRSADGLQVSVKSQLAYQHVFVESFALYLVVGCQYADGQGQVVSGSFLLDVGRRRAS